MRHVALVGFTFLLLAAPDPAVLQTVPGSISGRVVDASRSPVAGAEVRLINEQTRDTRKLSTDDAGDFLFLSVLPAPYTIRKSRLCSLISPERAFT